MLQQLIWTQRQAVFWFLAQFDLPQSIFVDTVDTWVDTTVRTAVRIRVCQSSQRFDQEADQEGGKPISSRSVHSAPQGARRNFRFLLLSICHLELVKILWDSTHSLSAGSSSASQEKPCTQGFCHDALNFRQTRSSSQSSVQTGL